MEEYTAMAKLINYINKRLITEFENIGESFILIMEKAVNANFIVIINKLLMSIL